MIGINKHFIILLIHAAVLLAYVAPGVHSAVAPQGADLGVFRVRRLGYYLFKYKIWIFFNFIYLQLVEEIGMVDMVAGTVDTGGAKCKLVSKN